jgi:hypothetical protein
MNAYLKAAISAGERTSPGSAIAQQYDPRSYPDPSQVRARPHYRCTGAGGPNRSGALCLPATHRELLRPRTWLPRCVGESRAPPAAGPRLHWAATARTVTWKRRHHAPPPTMQAGCRTTTQLTRQQHSIFAVFVVSAFRSLSPQQSVAQPHSLSPHDSASVHLLSVLPRPRHRCHPVSA